MDSLIDENNLKSFFYVSPMSLMLFTFSLSTWVYVTSSMLNNVLDTKNKVLLKNKRGQIVNHTICCCAKYEMEGYN